MSDYPREPTVETLRLNKREAFDGMRAYSESEIQHSHHIQRFLAAVLAFSGTAFVAVAGAAVLGRADPVVVRLLTAAIALVSGLTSLRIVQIAARKIVGAHAVYGYYGGEYVRTSLALGLTRRVRVHDPYCVLNPDEVWPNDRGEGLLPHERITIVKPLFERARQQEVKSRTRILLTRIRNWVLLIDTESENPRLTEAHDQAGKVARPGVGPGYEETIALIWSYWVTIAMVCILAVAVMFLITSGEPSVKDSIPPTQLRFLR